MNRLNLQYMLFIIAITSVLCGIFNFLSSIHTSEYKEVSGYITDVETTSELTRSGRRTLYNYTIIWTCDGKMYKRNVHEAMNAPDESTTEFWADENNTTAIASSPTEIRNEAYLNIIVAIVSVIFGGILHSRTKKTDKSNKKNTQKETDENYYYYALIVLAIGMFFGIVILALLLLSDLKEGKPFNKDELDVLSVLSVSFVICLIGIKIKKIRLKNR